MSGSRKWPATAWRALLELALPALDAVDDGRLTWTLGGGTALALRLDHRVSYDVDIFLEHAGRLAALSPNRNPAARAITGRWQEPGHYLKLEREEGEIDFIVAAQLTAVEPWRYAFRGRAIAVEAPAEILAKKLRYRGSRLLARDIFDLLAIRRAEPASIGIAVAAAPDATRRAIDRIERIADRYRRTIRDEVNPTSGGAELLELDPLDAARALASAS